MASPNEMRLADIAARGGQEQYEFDKFKAMTGRSDKNPYGDAGMFGRNADYRGDPLSTNNRGMTQKSIDNINRLAYEQFLGLQSGEGYQGSGMTSPKQGYAPALKIGEYVPGGTVQRAAPRGTGLGSFFKDGGFLGAFLSNIGGQAPRKFVPFGNDGDALNAVNYDSAPNPAAMRRGPTTRSDEELASMMLTRDASPAIMPSNPVTEQGVFDVSPMEAIANPGGQAFPDPAADMVDMSGMLDNNSPLGNPNVNVSDLLDLRERNQQTTAILDDAINAVGRVNPDEQRSPSSARKIEQDLLDAILAREIENREAQARDRSAQNIQNLVAALPPRPLNEQGLDMMPLLSDLDMRLRRGSSQPR